MPQATDAPDALEAIRLDVLDLARTLSGQGADDCGPNTARAAGFLAADGLASETGAAFVRAVGAGDLDAACELLVRSHPPFAAYMDAIRAEGAIARGQAARHVRRRGIRVSPSAANALALSAVHLGQAYTTLGRIRDGSRRPPAADLAAILRETAEAAAADGLVRVSDLVGPVCARARISPYALDRALDRDASIAAMAGLQLSSSAGGPVRGRDAVLFGDEGGFRLEPVPADRFRIGQRPVLVCSLERGRG